MLNKLKELIFGLNEYEKTKIEDRFFLAKNILSNLSIEKLEDFEILEDINYKIKEELRIKSSNLNRVIKSIDRNLKRSDVDDFLILLDKIKSDFLNKAFTIIEENEKEVGGEIRDVGIGIREEKEKIDKGNVEINLEEDSILFSNDDVKIRIENGKIPYLLIDFFEEVDLVLIKNISSVLFETMSAHGTNIIIESQKVLIIPRFNEDKLFDLPRIQVDIEEVFKRFDLKGERIEEEGVSPDSNLELPYVDIESIEKPIIKKSLKEKEDSLDSLLNEIDSKKINLVPPPNPNNDNSKPEIIKEDENIIVEKKNEEFKNNEIEIEKKIEEKIIKNEPQLEKKSETLTSEIEIEKKIEEKIIKNEPQLEKKSETLTSEIQTKKFEVYRDDKVLAYIEENSKVLGELIIESVDKKNIINFDESQMAYVSIFSKLFSTILFETMSAHGTNLIWDFNDNKIRIIPRFDKDNLNNLKWDTKSNTNEFLDQVKNKLILEMGKEVGEKKAGDQKSEVEGKKRQKKQENKTDLEEKANFVLESLKRIP